MEVIVPPALRLPVGLQPVSTKKLRPETLERTQRKPRLATFLELGLFVDRLLKACGSWCNYTALHSNTNCNET